MTTSFTLLVRGDVWNSLQANFAGTVLATLGLVFVPWALARKKETPYLYVAPDAAASPDWLEFCRVFKVKPGEKRYEIEVIPSTRRCVPGWESTMIRSCFHCSRSIRR